MNASFAAPLLAACLMTTVAAAEQVQPEKEPLLREKNLVQIGVFKTPSNMPPGEQQTYEYSNGPIAYNPAHHSLFCAGHAWYNQVGEISVPQDLNGESEVLQPLSDGTEGAFNTLGYGGTMNLGGLLVADNDAGDSELLITLFYFYDANCEQICTHVTRPLDLSVTGKVKGPSQVGGLNGGFYSGYMCTIPAEWRAKLGGSVLTGNSCLNIISRTSLGPCAQAIDPWDLKPDGAQPLVYYPMDHASLGNWGETPTKYYGGSDAQRGVVFPEHTASVLFFGRHGMTFSYGNGTDDKSLDGTTSPEDGEPRHYDPTSAAKGVHGYPYIQQIWAYDANDLAAVHAGKQQPWDVKPYAMWPLKEFSSCPIGAAYDAKDGLIFVSEAGENGKPLIHVYKITLDDEAKNGASVK